MSDLSRRIVEHWAGYPIDNKVTVLSRALLLAWDALEEIYGHCSDHGEMYVASIARKALPRED